MQSPPQPTRGRGPQRSRPAAVRRSSSRPIDLIFGFGGLPVSGMDDLLCLLTEDRVGVPVPVVIIRAFERRQLAITPAESGRD